MHDGMLIRRQSYGNFMNQLNGDRVGRVGERNIVHTIRSRILGFSRILCLVFHISMFFYLNRIFLILFSDITLYTNFSLNRLRYA